jgi:phosphatidate cytidylyltransferase
MIRTRILVGTSLAAAVAGILIVDRWIAPWYPCLFVCLMLVGFIATRELIHLFPAEYRPREWLVVFGAMLILASNFALPFGSRLNEHIDIWGCVILIFVVMFAIAFFVEMSNYREPGFAVPRIAYTTLAFVYLGLFGSFFAQIRWLGDPSRTSLMLALTIFVPKAGDVGAFFTGTFLGRHKMTPFLSPKKTWEGFIGGTIAAAFTAILFSYFGDVFRHGIVEAAAFGIVVGSVGVLGDLAESLIKRDGRAKDAAQSIPGFGGLLDVVDSVLFAAPVAYVWFKFG